ncbi:MAG: ThuA domain-containing protein [Planctomycetaceae bacterium]|nr:ThuA domain-containing protein [Planctomycetaceae bacterium]
MTLKCVSQYCVLLMTLLASALFVPANGFQTAFAQPAPEKNSLEKKNKVKVLVVTGIEYHVWQETAPQIAKQLASCPELDVKLEPDYNILCTDRIFDYDVIFFNFCNLREYADTKDDKQAIDNIEKFLRSGKGIVIYHFAIGMFEKNADRIMPLIGRFYDRDLPPHDPFGNFEVNIVDKEHPITKNIPNFKIDDELYTCATGDLPIHVLAEATSVNLKKNFPMAFLHKYGEGYAFTTVLGHDLRTLQSEEFVTLLRNAVLWLGKKEVPKEPAQVVSPATPLPLGKK